VSQKWEHKVIQSRVADFDPAAPPVVQNIPPPQPQAPRQPQQFYFQPPHYIKTEPVERPYVPMGAAPLPPNIPYTLPPINAIAPNHSNGRPGQSVLVLPKGAPPPTTQISQQNGSPLKYAGGGGSGGRIPQLDGPSYLPSITELPAVSMKIPQLDGPSSSGSGSDTSSPKTKAQGASGGGPTRGGGDEEINSDLDDSDSDGDGEDVTTSGGADQDIVFCTYDKVRPVITFTNAFAKASLQVARVKNKWKCVLKDGMIHVGGKDYLFAKCNG
jgi:transcription initiation factor TFIIA large subunit